MEEPGRLQSMGSLESDTTEWLHFHFGNGNPLQCSCLENPRDGKPGWLPSMRSHRVRHDWRDAAAAANTPIVWEERRKHKLQSQTGPCICSATSRARGIVLTPQENLIIIIIIIIFFFYNGWITTYLMGLWRKLHDTAQHFVTQILSKCWVNQTFCLLPWVDVWLSIGRTVIGGGKEAEVGGRRAAKFWVKSVMTEMKNSNPVR